MINRSRNTKRQGTMEFLVYKEGDTFVGVCLTFDIVEEGTDPIELMKSIKEAAMLHLKVVTEKNLSDDLLNRYAPQEYWDRYFNAMEKIKEPGGIVNNFPVVSPYYHSMAGALIS